MPTLPDVPQTLKIAISGSIDSGTWTNVLHFQYAGGPPTNANLNAFATEVSTAWTSALAPRWGNNVTLKQIQIEDLTSSTGAVGAWGGAVVGTAAALSAPANTCVLIKHTIARRYRGGHPRTYLLPPLSTERLDSTTLTTGAITGYNAAWTTFITSLTSYSDPGWTSLKQVSVSYYTGHSLRPIPTVDIVTGSSCETKFATQRRRLAR